MRFKIPGRFSEISIDELELDQRAVNALKRNKVFNIGEALDIDLMETRNCGVVTVKRIKNSILNYVIPNMTDMEIINMFTE